MVIRPTSISTYRSRRVWQTNPRGQSNPRCLRAHPTGAASGACEPPHWGSAAPHCDRGRAPVCRVARHSGARFCPTVARFCPTVARFCPTVARFCHTVARFCHTEAQTAETFPFLSNAWAEKGGGRSPHSATSAPHRGRGRGPSRARCAPCSRPGRLRCRPWRCRTSSSHSRRLLPPCRCQPAAAERDQHSPTPAPEDPASTSSSIARFSARGLQVTSHARPRPASALLARVLGSILSHLACITGMRPSRLLRL